ncbi:MAG: DUF2066 domain-containing protein [Pseudomonadota bacterium]
MKNVFYLFCILAWWIFVSGAQAAEVKDLYEAEVPVTDQTATRSQAIQAALLRVITKVSGQANLSPAVRAAAAQRAERLVLQFRHQSAAGSGSRPQLWARFGESEVNQLLQEFGLPVWGSVRPSLLVWLAVEDKGARLIVGGEEGKELQAMLNSAAQARGVPLLLPVRDLEEQRRLNVADLWGGFDERIGEASRRYQADEILVGRVYPSGSRWTAHWSRSDVLERQSWQNSAGSLDELISQAVATVADMLAARYARVVTPGQASFVRLRIEGVTGVKAYARVMGYLKSLDHVQQVALREAHGDSLVAELSLLGDYQQLAQLIRLGQVLAPQPGASAESGQSEYVYQLQP